MLIDTNAYLGPWATRRLRYSTPSGLLQLMDRAGITHACVSSASAVMYRNCHAGNEELAQMLEAAGRETPDLTGRLIPFAVLSPAYAGWERDLRWCHEVLGAKGLRLHPGYHGYRLTDPRCHDLIVAAASLDMVISVPQRMEDYRQRHWLLDAPDVNLNDLASLIEAHPEARFVVNNAAGAGASDLVGRSSSLPMNYWVDICRPDVVYHREAIGLIEAMGTDRIVFGSGIPFNYPEPATLRLEVLQAQGYEVEKIASKNARALLGL